MSSDLDRLHSALADRYRIERELGEGGMATVYLAEDLRHDRKVAIKVLKPELAAVIGAERFLAEIKTTANLQHPHILPLFHSGEADGFLFYVMPYVAGESLRDRLDRVGELPMDEAVEIARAVSTALEHAHGRGVVHRDIKPANILLQDGQPQVADFGIALAVSTAGGGRLTETGMSLGTPMYMSPEQASATDDVTAQSDVYSLGCVLYEMLAGDPPHTGPNAQAILTRVLTEEPRRVTDVRRAVPAHVASATAKALEKLRADRFETAGQLSRALTDSTFRWPVVSAEGEAVTLRRWLAAAVGFAVIMAGVAVWSLLRPSPAPESLRVQRLAIPLPEGQHFAFRGGRSFPFDVSADGRLLVYAARSAEGLHLFLRDVESAVVRRLPGTEEARQPFFSPNGESVGFFADGRLQRVSVAGGTPLTVTTLEGGPFGASWGPDDTIIFGVDARGLVRVPATGGEAVHMPLIPVNEPLEGEADSASTLAAPTARWPQFLPNGTHALVTTESGSGVLDLESGELRYVISGQQATYLSSGHLIYNAGEQRMRTVPFDMDRLDVAGPESPALDDVFRGPGSGALLFRVSTSGMLVYVSGGFERSLVLVERSGRESPLDLEPRGYRFPDISPNGDLVAVTVDPRPSDIWIVDLRRLRGERLTTEGHNINASWSPAGDRLAWARAVSGSSDQFWIPWPEGGEPRVLVTRPNPQYAPTWLEDGRVVVHETTPETGDDLIALDPRDGSSEPFWVTESSEWLASASSDGKWLAFTSNASGVNEVWVLPASLSTRPQQVSIGGGTDARWSADGSEIFYRNGNSIMSVRVRTSPSFEADRPEELFSGSFDFTQTNNWDVGPDSRFVMVRGDPRTTSQFQVILNWFNELEPGADN